MGDTWMNIDLRPATAVRARHEASLAVIGVHIGQKAEHTGLAVVEIELRLTGAPASARRRTDWHYVVRFLQRLDPGIRYPQLAHRLNQILQGIATRADQKPVIVVDATDLGSPVVDFLRREVPGAHRIWEVHFNFGAQRSEDRENYVVRLGKAYLVSRMTTLLQSAFLHMPRTAEADTLARELLAYEVHLVENADARQGAFKIGLYDELITAVGLATQKEPKGSIYPGRAIYYL
jgi:hypothetical protein